jgi:hemolysin type calcium-binding protein
MNKRRRLVGFLVVGAMLVPVAAGVAMAATVACGGERRCVGTELPDRITGDASDNFVVAMDGDDAVDAGPGDDVVEGNRGDDRPSSPEDPSRILDGGQGDDTVMGGLGADALEDRYSGDKDRLFGGAGRDFVDGVDSDALDFVDCGGGKDFFDADSGDTVLDNCEKRF